MKIKVAIIGGSGMDDPKLMKDINFPNGLTELGFSEAEIPQLVQGTLKQQRTLSCSPRPVTANDLEKMFADSMSFW